MRGGFPGYINPQGIFLSFPCRSAYASTRIFRENSHLVLMFNGGAELGPILSRESVPMGFG